MGSRVANDYGRAAVRDSIAKLRSVITECYYKDDLDSAQTIRFPVKLP